MEPCRRPARAAHVHNQRGSGGSPGIAVDCGHRRRRGPLAGVRSVGSLDQGARPAERPHLEHPSRPPGRALGRDVAGPGKAGRSRAAAYLDTERRLGRRQRSMVGRDFRRLAVDNDEAGRRGAHTPRHRRDPSLRSRRRADLRHHAPRRGRPPGQAVGCHRLRRLPQRRPIGPRALPAHRATVIAATWGVGIRRRPVGEHVGHESGGAVEGERRPMAPVPAVGRAAQRPPVHRRHRCGRRAVAAPPLRCGH